MRSDGSIPAMVWGNARIPGSHPLNHRLEPQPTWLLARPGTTGVGRGRGWGRAGALQGVDVSQASLIRRQLQTGAPPPPSEPLVGEGRPGPEVHLVPGTCKPHDGLLSPPLQGKALQGPQPPKAWPFLHSHWQAAPEISEGPEPVLPGDTHGPPPTPASAQCQAHSPSVAQLYPQDHMLPGPALGFTCLADDPHISYQPVPRPLVRDSAADRARIGRLPTNQTGRGTLSCWARVPLASYRARLKSQLCSDPKVIVTFGASGSRSAMWE